MFENRARPTAGAGASRNLGFVSCAWPESSGCDRLEMATFGLALAQGIEHARRGRAPRRPGAHLERGLDTAGRARAPAATAERLVLAPDAAKGLPAAAACG